MGTETSTTESAGNAAPRERSAVATSVIVITRDRPDGLARLLASLAAQTQPPGEVVVVMNACRVSYDAARARWDGALPVRWVTEPTPGVAHARNAGVAAARGEILLFIDDDCEADARWIERLVAPFALNPHIGIVGGEILSAPTRGTLVEAFCVEESLMQLGREAAGVGAAADASAGGRDATSVRADSTRPSNAPHAPHSASADV